jgi:hypothetical protein
MDDLVAYPPQLLLNNTVDLCNKCSLKNLLLLLILLLFFKVSTVLDPGNENSSCNAPPSPSRKGIFKEKRKACKLTDGKENQQQSHHKNASLEVHTNFLGDIDALKSLSHNDLFTKISHAVGQFRDEKLERI